MRRENNRVKLSFTEKFLKEELPATLKSIQRLYINFFPAISSLFFLFWVFWIIFFQGKHLKGEYLLFLAFITLYFLKEKKLQKSVSKNKKKFIRSLIKKISTLGSIFVLFLFSISYLKPTNSLSQQFFILWEGLENRLNNVLLLIVADIIFFLIPFVFFFELATILYKKIETENESRNLQILSLLVILACLIPFSALFIVLTIPLFEPVVMFFYSNLNWIFGFSLIFIHSNYLVKEAERKFKLKKALKKLKIIKRLRG